MVLYPATPTPIIDDQSGGIIFSIFLPPTTTLCRKMSYESKMQLMTTIGNKTLIKQEDTDDDSGDDERPPGAFFDLGMHLHADITFYIKRPYHHFHQDGRLKNQYVHARPGASLHDYATFILPVLEGVVFQDDEQIVSIAYEKIYASVASTTVHLCPAPIHTPPKFLML